MSDRFSEIISLLDKLTALVSEELMAQKEALAAQMKELEDQSGTIAQLKEKVGQLTGTQPVTVQIPAMNMEEDAIEMDEDFPAAEEDGPEIPAEEDGPFDEAVEPQEEQPQEELQQDTAPYGAPEISGPAFPQMAAAGIPEEPDREAALPLGERLKVCEPTAGRSAFQEPVGPKVDNLREAFSINDKIFFIRELFDGEPRIFDLTVDYINGLNSYDEAIGYLHSSFGDWNEESEAVHEFNMALMRRFRD